MENIANLMTSLSNTMIIPAPRVRYFSFLLSKVTNKKIDISLHNDLALFLKKKNVKNGLSQDWLELVQWFWNEFLQLVNAFFIAIMSMTIHSKKILKPLHPRILFQSFFKLFGNDLITTYIVNISMQ